MNINILLADGFEEMEAIIVCDLLKRANYNVSLISTTEQLEVTGSHNIVIKADRKLDLTELNLVDLIFIPGGLLGVNNLINNNEVIHFIKTAYQKNIYLACICAAPKLLEFAGLSVNKKMTCYPSLKEDIPSAIYIQDNVVIDNKIITSRGPATSADLAFKIIEILSNYELSQKIASETLFII